MMRSFISVFCLCLILAASGCGSRQDEGSQKQVLTVLNPKRDFNLTDQDGQPFHLKDHRGEIVLLFFGYLSCPDICPVTLSKLSRVYKQLGTKSQKILTLFVSVDPQRDTPEKLKEYLKYFKLNVIGLTGTKEQIDAVVDAYKGYYQFNETGKSGDYLVDHSSYVYVIDGKGQVRALAHFEDTSDTIASLIKKL